MTELYFGGNFDFIMGAILFSNVLDYLQNHAVLLGDGTDVTVEVISPSAICGVVTDYRACCTYHTTNIESK